MSPTSPPSADLTGQVALVTGGAGGLGRATCVRLADCGAHVVVVDVAAHDAETFASEYHGVSFLTVDLTDANQVARAFEETVQRFGRLDIVINNAGVDVTCPVDDLSVEDWDRIIGVNLRAPFLLARHAFMQMRHAHGGQIVNIVSTAAKRAWANASAYHASKWGLLGLSHALHVEGRQYGIKVCAVVAGGMRTPFLLDRFDDIDESLLQEPADVADAIIFALTRPESVVVPELLIVPMKETSWP